MSTGTPSTASHKLALSEFLRKFLRSENQTYFSAAERSWAMSCASLFSSPCPMRLENGRLFGSAQTRRGGRSAAVQHNTVPSQIKACQRKLGESEDRAHAS